ncbi:unnamed protein product [Boreogadus saida]
MVKWIRVGVMCHKGFDGYPGPDSVAGIQTGFILKLKGTMPDPKVEFIMSTMMGHKLGLLRARLHLRPNEEDGTTGAAPPSGGAVGADYPRNFCRASGRVSNDPSVLMPFGQRRETAKLRLKEASANEDEMSTSQSVESTEETPACPAPGVEREPGRHHQRSQLHHKADLKCGALTTHTCVFVLRSCALRWKSPCDLPDLEALGTAGDRERPTQLTLAGVRLRTPGVASFLPVLLQS